MKLPGTLTLHSSLRSYYLAAALACGIVVNAQTTVPASAIPKEAFASRLNEANQTVQSRGSNLQSVLISVASDMMGESGRVLVDSAASEEQKYKAATFCFFLNDYAIWYCQSPQFSNGYKPSVEDVERLQVYASTNGRMRELVNKIHGIDAVKVSWGNFREACKDAGLPVPPEVQPITGRITLVAKKPFPLDRFKAGELRVEEIIKAVKGLSTSEVIDLLGRPDRTSPTSLGIQFIYNSNVANPYTGKPEALYVSFADKPIDKVLAVQAQSTSPYVDEDTRKLVNKYIYGK